MLQIIREKLTGWFAIFILGAIALTLVVSFGNIDTGFSGGTVAATVNGEDIPYRDFQQLYQRQKQQWEASYRTQMPDALAVETAGSVVQALVRNRVVAQYVREQGYRTNDYDVIKAISENPAFHVGGQFSQPGYEQMLGSQGLSTQRYEYEQRQSMEIGQFIEGLGYSAFYTPAEFRRYIELDGESRDLEYTILLAADRAREAAVSDEQAEDYYAANPVLFQTEESVSLDFIEIDFNAMAESADVSADDAQLYYAEHPEEFKGPDERLVRHILIPFGDDEIAALGQAEQIRERLVGGEAFADLAAQYSADTGTAGIGGELGWLGAGDSPAAEFEDVLFTLAVAEISEPVRTDYGFHLIQLDGERAGNAQEFATVKDDLIARLRDEAAENMFGELLDELDERALESMDGLGPVAAAMGLDIKRVAEFTRSGGLPLGYSPQLVDTVFSLEVLEDGENSPVIDMGDGRAVVLQVVEYRPPAAKPFADVREEILAQLRSDAAILLTATVGNELLDELNSGGNVDQRLEALGASWQRPAGLRRGSGDLPADLAAAVFKSPRPEKVKGPGYQGLMLASGDFAVYRIQAVSPGQPELYSVEDRDQRKAQLAGRLGGGQATAVVEAIAQEADVRVTPDLIGSQTDLL